MDLDQLLKTINNVDDYFTITRAVTNKQFNSKTLLNISTVLALKQIRSIEVEYFAKCSENGAAIKIIELMFMLPPSDPWSKVGKELVLLIQYWLDAIRKHLIIHNINWWTFLNILLNFIKDIQLKIPSFNDILTKEIAECLFDLATQTEPNCKQRAKIISCLNRICAKSNREIRYNMKEKIDSYLANMSAIMATCGDFCTQFNIMEILLRWLCNHQDLAVRKEASTKWFPSTLYSEHAVAIFLKRPWFNLFEDVRAFLNAHNAQGEHIISVLCKKLFVGDIKLIYDTDKINYYIDLNSESKCISLILNSKLLQILGSSLSDTFIIHEDNTRNIQMFIKSPNIIIMISIFDPLKMHPSNILNGKYNVTIEISSTSDVTKVNRALKNIFDTKYELLMDIEDPVKMLSYNSTTSRTSVDDNSRLSDSIHIQRKYHSGLMVWGRNIASNQSPSSTSTSSLAMLREKLKAYPRCKVKEKVRVQALPSLSKVSEVTETYEDCINLTQSTLKLRSYGICYTNKKKHLNISSGDNDSNKSDNNLSPPTINYDNSISLLSNIASVDNSVINDTLEPIRQATSNINTNLVDAFAWEDLNSQTVKTSNNAVASNKIVVDNIEKNIFYSENVYNCPINNNSEKLNPIVVKDTSNALNDIERKTKKNDLSKEKSTRKQKRIIISNTTSNESNFEIVENTPNVMRVIEKVTKNNIDSSAFENFFTEHLIDTKKNESVVISPTLARKINTTSSDSSELLDIEPITDIDFNFDIDEIEQNVCSKNAIDAALNNLDKHCRQNQKNCDAINDTGLQISSKENVNGSEEKLPKSKKTSKSKDKSQRQNRKQKTQLRSESVIKSIGFPTNYEMPLTRRKRKLYSDKDDDKVMEVNFPEIEKDTPISTFKVCEKVYNSAATSYKEIENIRRKSQQRIRNKKSMETVMSPKTKNMNDVFDNLIRTDDTINIANKKTPEQFAIYNFRSDSDQDNDFESQTVQAINSTTVSVKSNNIRSMRGRKVVNCEPRSTRNKKKPNHKNTKQVVKETIRKRATKPRKHLIDEHMRDYNSSEILNTTYIMEVPDDEIKEPEPILNLKPQMEVDNNSAQNEHLKKTHKHNITSKLSLNRRNKPEKSHNSTRESEISLPDLNVEKAEILRDNEDVALEKLKDIYENIVQDMGNAAQNILVDLDQNNNSPSLLNNTNESIKSKTNLITRNVTKKNKTKLNTIKDKVNKRTTKKKSNIIKNNKQKINNKSIIELDRNDVTRNKFEINQIVTLNASNVSVAGTTIATFGNSPITAHGTLSESPPNTKLLNRTIQGRGLDTQDMNKTRKEYFETLIENLNTNIENKSSSNKDESPILLIDSSDANNFRSVKNPTVQVNKSPSVSITRLSSKELSKWFPPRHNSIFGSNQSSNSSTQNFKNGDQSDKNSTKLYKSLQELRKSRETIISPIKMHDEEKVTSVSPQEDTYVDRIKSIMGTKFCEPTNLNQKPRYNLRSTQQESNSYRESVELPNTKPDPVNLPRYGTIGTSSSDEKNIFVNTIKRKLHPIMKKKQIGVLPSVEESVSPRPMSAIRSTSGSSIQDWFKRNDHDKQTESQNFSLEDTLEPIIEKLDTTFDEIHHMTSRKFVNLFVDEEKGFDNLKQELRELNQNMFLELSTIFKKKSEEFEKRIEEKINNFMEKQKKSAQELIIEDCKKKKLMVKLLKEDLEAVLKHRANRNKTNWVDPVSEYSD